MTSREEHQLLREMLGALALGHLTAAETDRVRAHLDGCPACRAELAEVSSVVPLLDRVDPAVFASPVSPPSDLGGRIRAAVAAEPVPADGPTDRRTSRHARPGRTRTRLAVAAAAVLVVGVGAGGLLGRSTAPTEPAAAPGPYEPISLEVRGGSALEVERAGLVPHTWGVELAMDGTGFTEGEVYRAAFRDRRGRLRPAGRFLGTGAATMSCSLQSGALREDVRAVVVRDERGRTVLRTSL